MGGVDPAYLKLMMKRLSDQGVLIRAARGVYVNPTPVRSLRTFGAASFAFSDPAKSAT